MINSTGYRWVKKNKDWRITKMYGQVARETLESTDAKKTLRWLRKADL